MFDELNDYKHSDHCFFKPSDELDKVCNAPKNCAGVYIVYALVKGNIELIYIGSSGKVVTNGKLRLRNGGIYDRIVNGKQFDERRKISWPKK